MIPMVPAVSLAFFSFLCSVFIILRILIPILPPSPLSKRVSPAEFGLPKFRSLSVADKSHIWLASLDIVALIFFVWQAFNEATGGPSDVANASDPASAVRMWIVITIRQTCLLIVGSITLLHVRMGRPVSFGEKHWMIWAPTVLLAVTSTGIAAVISATDLQFLFIGLISYTSTIAMVSSVAFTFLIRTLVTIKRNLANLNEESDPWPPLRITEGKPRPSFATEDINAIRDGASWITSNASSLRDSVSAWSFSTHETGTTFSHQGHGSGRSHKGFVASVPAESPFWFRPNVNDFPPVPPIPSPYGSLLPPTSQSCNNLDPFRREAPSLPEQPRARLDSQTSWLTSTNGSHTTMTAWSYPSSEKDCSSIHKADSLNILSPLTPVSRPLTPQLASAQVLGGYGYTPGICEAEKGLAVLTASSGNTIDISILRLIGWLLYIGVPFALSLPYLITVSQKSTASTTISVVFILSVTLSSPILALAILLRSPIPIPSGLFDVHRTPENVIHAHHTPYMWSQDCKRSMCTSPTVVEGRRSGDIWITNGDAIDGKGKMGRAMGMLSSVPKLFVLTPKEFEDEPCTKPLPFKNEEFSLPVILHNRSRSETSHDSQFNRLRKDSKASSHLSEARGSLAYASKIMVAQRHYSALAHTVVIPGSSPETNQAAEKDGVLGTATGATPTNAVRQSIHLRSRSISSTNGSKIATSGTSSSPNLPPNVPLPPTPPSVKSARLASLAHKKSFSSEYIFGSVDDVNEIDALTVGVLPLLVPGINGTKDKEEDRTSPNTFSKRKGRKVAKKLADSEDSSSPEVTMPVGHLGRDQRPRKTHKRSRYSLPSFGLGKEGVQSLSKWNAEIRGASAVPARNIEIGWRNTVFGGEFTPNTIPYDLPPNQSNETLAKGAVGLNRAMSSARSLGLRADVPHGLDTPRESVSSMVPPFSAASTTTLFEDFAAGLEENPEAQSTPHNTITNKPTSKYPAPALPLLIDKRCSSVKYIKSDDHAQCTTPTAEPTTTSPAFSVRLLVPKAGNHESKETHADLFRSASKPGSPRGNLRPLRLLQDRDNNTPAGPRLNSTRPLFLGKRQVVRGTAPISQARV